MSASHDDSELDKGLKRADTAKPGEPDWTAGLKRLYDSVVDEPLPATFKDLLSKLDAPGGK